MDTQRGRRAFLADLATGSGALLLAWSLPGVGVAAAGEGGEKEENEVPVVEDLMQEHGLLRRVFLVYDEACARLGSGRGLDPRIVRDAVTIVRRFGEDYHEKNEETELFPRFDKAGRQRELVATLRTQHAKGRELTDELLRLSADGAATTPEANARLASAMQVFLRMYRPHAAREDTVLFREFRRIVSPPEYRELGERFEEEEERLLGKDGFEAMLEKVLVLERELGIADLAGFTPAGAGGAARTEPPSDQRRR